MSYGPIGAKDRTVTTARITQLQPEGKGNASTNPAIGIARMRWGYIQPRYEAWKAGQVVPESGTPFSAWTGISREQADIMAQHGVHSVEELSALTDAHIQRVPLPGLRNLIEGAKRFVAAGDSRVRDAEMKKRDETIDSQAAQIDDLKAKLDELAGMVAKQMDRPVKPARTEAEKEAAKARMAKARAAKGQSAAA